MHTPHSILSSPGRSPPPSDTPVRALYAQLHQLQKENFDLRLRAHSGDDDGNDSDDEETNSLYRHVMDYEAKVQDLTTRNAELLEEIEFLRTEQAQIENQYLVLQNQLSSDKPFQVSQNNEQTNALQKNPSSSYEDASSHRQKMIEEDLRATIVRLRKQQTQSSQQLETEQSQQSHTDPNRERILALQQSVSAIRINLFKIREDFNQFCLTQSNSLRTLKQNFAIHIESTANTHAFFEGQRSESEERLLMQQIDFEQLQRKKDAQFQNAMNEMQNEIDSLVQQLEQCILSRKDEAVALERAEIEFKTVLSGFAELPALAQQLADENGRLREELRIFKDKT
ncbi:hypothetical protein BLNAU_6699 [Blattamonas nauphoetae]|uniref:Uncharacterized protein n=1 Tax=Blattamonas nauphoetae TaxID=2049346 RepID=A0ABQ9Y3Z2_9EUKA|nr:hypothetical protein BLNAU_6699 [Blattamonas nauphoetae]